LKQDHDTQIKGSENQFKNQLKDKENLIAQL